MAGVRAPTVAWHLFLSPWAVMGQVRCDEAAQAESLDEEETPMLGPALRARISRCSRPAGVHHAGRKQAGNAVSTFWEIVPGYVVCCGPLERDPSVMYLGRRLHTPKFTITEIMICTK